MDLPAKDGVEVSLAGHVLTIVLDRPDHRNALRVDQFLHVAAACQAAEDDDEVRVVVITGSGDAFCTGVDMSSFDVSSSAGRGAPVRASEDAFLLPIVEMSKPLIAVVNGLAVGGGLGLALCCDLRIASDRARFSTAFGRVGLTANDAVAWALPRAVGLAKALELIYLARSIDAAEAERIGLVSYVYPHDELEAAAAELADAVAAGPPVATRFSKRLVLDGLTRSYRDHVLAQEYASLANRTLAAHDIAEGLTAVSEQRPPAFRGAGLPDPPA